MKENLMNVPLAEDAVDADLTPAEREAYDRGFNDAYKISISITSMLQNAKRMLENDEKMLIKVIAERDAAIGELRNMPNSCRFCKWYADESCIIPNTCCVDDSPDRWEWRGLE